MTHPTLDHEERLRSALRAAADSIEPAADGLGRIRARLTPPRPVIAAWMVSWTEPVMLRLRLAVPWLRLRLGLAHGRIGPVAGRARPALGQLGTLFGGTGTAPTPIRPTSGNLRAASYKVPVRAAAWLRPAAAIAAFVVIIGSGALAIGQLQQTATLARHAAAFGHSRRRHSSVRGGGRADADAAGARQLKNPWLKSPGWPLAPPASKFSMSLLAPIPLPAGPAPSSTCPPSQSPKPSPPSSPTPTPPTLAVAAGRARHRHRRPRRRRR